MNEREVLPMNGFTSDLHHVLRGLRRSPGFTFVAVTSLAIGIGANAAMFGLVRTLLLTRLPVDAPAELRIIGWRHDGNVRFDQYGSTEYEDPDGGLPYRSNFSYPLYRTLQDGAPPGVGVFGFAFLRGVSVAAVGEPALLAGGALADGRYFGTLEPRMALGRGLGPGDDTPDAPLVAVLSHTFWLRAFGGDPGVLGRTIRVNGEPAQVIGVTAPGFKGLSLGGFFPQTEITLPLAAQPRVYPQLAPGPSLFTADDVFWVRVMARAPASLNRASVADRFETALIGVPSPLASGEGQLSLRLLDGAQGAQPPSRENARTLHVLQGVVGIVLLIACMNLAVLMLARGAARQRETAVRQALGAGRARLLRAVMIEALIVAAGGAFAGVVLAFLSPEVLRALLIGSLGTGAFGDVDLEAKLDPPVLALSAVLALLVAIVSGLIPALRLSRATPGGSLTRRGVVADRARGARALLAIQLAVSVPLVLGAGLFLRTIANLGGVPLGFDPGLVAAFQVDPGSTRLAPAEYPGLYEELLARIQETRGIESATLMENLPLSGLVTNTTIQLGGQPHRLYRNAVGAEFIETMGARLVAGRMPDSRDGPRATRVGAVNETVVRELFGSASPLGSTIEVDGASIEIVGVINDMPYRSRRAPVPATLYESALQRPGRTHVLVRSTLQPSTLEPLLREMAASIDPDLPVPAIQPVSAVISQSTAKERVFTQLLTVFGALALLLAAIGLYGLTSQSVTRRTSEFGVRLAVGARRGQLLWLVLREVLLLAGIGLAVGVPAALASSRLIAALLYDVAPSSPAPLAAAIILLVAVAIGAGLGPARRAARMDPLVAMRAD
jgi:predicted permease